MLDTKSRPEGKRGCQDDVKIVDFSVKESKLKAKRNLVYKRNGKAYKKVCKMYLIDRQLEIQDDDYLLKMGIDKNDCIDKLDELNTFGVVIDDIMHSMWKSCHGIVIEFENIVADIN